MSATISSGGKRLHCVLHHILICVALQAIASGSESAAACIASVRSAADMVAAGAAVPSSVERLIALSALKHEDLSLIHI